MGATAQLVPRVADHATEEERDGQDAGQDDLDQHAPGARIDIRQQWHVKFASISVRRMLPARGGGGQSRIKPLALHPLLAAAYPVLFLFAQNVAEQVTLQPLWIPLGAAIIGGAVALLIGRVVLGDWLRGALLATFALTLFFSFGHVWNLVGEMLTARRWLIGAYVVAALAGTILIWRGGRWVPALSRFLVFALAIGIAINAW